MNLTPEQAVEFIRAIPLAITRALEAEQPLAIIDMEGDLKQHVFMDGLAADGSKIGQYVGNEGYVSIEGARRRYGSQVPTSKLRGRGKNSRSSKFKNGKPRRSMYFAEGYKGLRELMGRQTSYVDLNFTDNLRMSIVSGTDGLTSKIEFLRDENATLAGHLEENYGKEIFVPTEMQVDALVERLTEAANSAIDRIMR
jgi:hypothetical protein